MRFLSEGMRRPNFIHERSRIHAHGQRTFGCSYQESNVRERDPCGEHGCRPGEVEGDAGEDGAGDREGEESQGGALGREGEKPEEDWVSAELIGGEIAFEGGPGPAGPRWGAETGCEGADSWGSNIWNPAT